MHIDLVIWKVDVSEWDGNNRLNSCYSGGLGIVAIIIVVLSGGVVSADIANTSLGAVVGVTVRSGVDCVKVYGKGSRH